MLPTPSASPLVLLDLVRYYEAFERVEKSLETRGDILQESGALDLREDLYTRAARGSK